MGCTEKRQKDLILKTDIIVAKHPFTGWNQKSLWKLVYFLKMLHLVRSSLPHPDDQYTTFSNSVSNFYDT